MSKSKNFPQLPPSGWNESLQPLKEEIRDLKWQVRGLMFAFAVVCAFLFLHVLPDLNQQIGKLPTEAELNKALDGLNHRVDDLTKKFAVSSIKDPRSNEDFQNGLVLATAYAKTLKGQPKGIISQNLSEISKALSGAVESHDADQNLWRTASVVLDASSHDKQGELVAFMRPCLIDSQATYVPHPPNMNSRRMQISLANCTLPLDDQVVWEESPFAASFNKEKKQGVTDTFYFVLNNVHIVYKGGTLIPFEALFCSGCTFAVEPARPANPTGRTLIRQFLASVDGDVKIESLG